MTKDLLKVYGFMNRYKGKIVDVPLSFKLTGLNADGDPKLAICRADGKRVFGTKYSDGRFKLQKDRRDVWNTVKSHGDLLLPAGTFTFPTETPDLQRQPLWKVIKNEKITAPVPIIPAKLLHIVKSNLANYYIFWEVEKWIPEPPKDPMLLKQLTPNLFGVLAAWDLTPLERAVIRGRL